MADCIPQSQRSVIRALIACGLLAAGVTSAQPPPTELDTDYFGIRIVDRETGRGVPLIELETTFRSRYVSDSAGWIAFYEPGLMGQEFWFSVSGDGYAHPADGFGYRGLRLTTTPGGRATIMVDRVNPSERLYRLTGVGIYRDSRLLDEPAPLAAPLVNAQVAGQDSALAHRYRGRIYWFWGDTNRLAYPLGLFKVAGATSELPEAGGLAPSAGIDFVYFAGSDGFARSVAPVEGRGVVWIDGLYSAPDVDGELRLFAHFERREGLGEVYEKGIVVWDDDIETFVKVAEFAADAPLHPTGRTPFVVTEAGIDYIVFTTPLPTLRVPRELAAVTDPARYEGFTPLVPGTRFAGADTALERDANGALVWAWKAGTAPLLPAEQAELVAAGLIEYAESPFRLVDVETGAPVQAHSGTVAFNHYLGRWLMVFGRLDGATSRLGEVRVAASDAIEGPWSESMLAASHEAYSYYNVAQRPFFDEDGGRRIYFEGTYTRSFSRSQTATPYYDYNQVMYALDLDRIWPGAVR
jgi:hypothetical protein